MTKLSLNDISEKMRDIDFAVLMTRTDGGRIAGRPMSNNREVEYDGDSYFFTCSDKRSVSDIQNDPKVALVYQSKTGMLGMKPFFLTVEGQATLIDDKAQFAAHWTSDLDDWFEQGIDTSDLTLIRVKALRLHYWDGMEEGELELKAGTDAAFA